MLGIKRMDHICMAVWKLEERLPMLTELLGMRIEGRFQNPQAGYNGVILAVPGGGAQWELLEPCDDDSFLARFLREKGPGFHHVTFEVESTERATEAIRGFGYEPFGGRAHGTYKEVFVHPRDTGGILVQLYEGGWSG